MPVNSLMGYMESHDEERTSFKAWKWGTESIKGGGTSANPVNDNNLENRVKQLLPMLPSSLQYQDLR